MSFVQDEFVQTYRHVLEAGQNQPDDTNIGSIPAWFWHIMACLQGLNIEWELNCDGAYLSHVY